MGIEIKSNVIYSNNNILFLGTVSGEKGLFKYDIRENKLTKQGDIKGAGNIKINSTNDTILISSSDYIDEERPNNGGESGIYLAKVDDSLNISKLTNIDYRSIKEEHSVFARGFSEDGKKFYLYKDTNEEEVNEENKTLNVGYYEVYEIE